MEPMRGSSLMERDTRWFGGNINRFSDIFEVEDLNRVYIVWSYFCSGV